MKCLSLPLVITLLFGTLVTGCGGKNENVESSSEIVKTVSIGSKAAGDEIRAMPPAKVENIFPEKEQMISSFKLPKSDVTTNIILTRPGSSEMAEVVSAKRGLIERQHQIGINRTISLSQENLSNSAKLHWVTLPNGGHVGSISVTSPDAAAIRVGLLIKQMPYGMELRFSGSDAPNAVVGPISSAQIHINQIYWSPTVDGSTVKLEIYLPQGSKTDELDLKINKISHLLSTPSSRSNVNAPEKGASYCEVDLACASSPSTALSSAGNSIAKMIYTKPDGNSYLCSGTLVNNTAKDPLFFSANHCISDQETASSLNTYWFYETASCGGKLKKVVQLFNGAKLLYNSIQNDFSLLKLNEQPPANATYAAWDATTITPQNLIGIHHPHGDVKKISTGTTDADFTIVNSKGSYTPVIWQQGITEPGSSGSGLFSFNGSYYSLRGALYAGSSSCESPSEADYFSRLDLAYPDIKQFLTSKPTPQSGWWWNSAESGRGFTIEIANNKMFFAGYLYDADGRATWYASGPTAMTTDSVYVGTLSSYRSGQTLTGSYKPSVPLTTSQGALTITFSDRTHGTLVWPGGVVAIERFNIVPGGLSAAIPENTPEVGWWWNPSESGRGFSIEIQNGNMFLAGYMYDNLGNPIWYASGPMQMTDAATYQGAWQQYGNGQTLTGLYKPSSVLNANVGSVTIRFSDKRNAVLTLPNNRLIPITRFTF